MKKLLEKIRSVNFLIQKNAALPLDFDELAKVIGECVESNTYIIGNEGQMLGHSMDISQMCETMTDILDCGRSFPQNYNIELLNVRESTINIQRHGICTFYQDRKCHLGNKFSTIIPIIGGGERLGTLVLSKLSAFYDDDVVLAEYCATVVGMETIRGKAQEVSRIARERAAVTVAVRSLSYSEVGAVVRIFEELTQGEGIIIASKIAKNADITRSVIVNALRKLESAGVIEANSLGVKGTHIKILNEFLLPELQRLQLKLI